MDVIDPLQNDTTMVSEESGQDMSWTLIKSHLDDLKQQLEQIKEQLNNENSIQVIRGTVI